MRGGLLMPPLNCFASQPSLQKQLSSTAEIPKRTLGFLAPRRTANQAETERELLRLLAMSLALHRRVGHFDAFFGSPKIEVPVLM